jgi:hypothetical protein
MITSKLKGITLRDFITRAYALGATPDTIITYKDMNFGGIDTCYEFTEDNIDMEIIEGVKVITIDSIPWEPID